MVSHTSITDLLALPMQVFDDIVRAIERVLERQKEMKKGG